MAGYIKQIFTWWNGNTIGTRVYTFFKGKYVGEDLLGNKYYEGGRHKDGYKRRWVVYKNYSEASAIPPGWHGWIHYRTDVSPAQEAYCPHEWEKPHQPNLTGTPQAYTPKGSIAHGGKRPRVSGDYQAWSPEK